MQRGLALAGGLRWREVLLLAVSQLVVVTRCPRDAAALVEELLKQHAEGSWDRALVVFVESGAMFVLPSAVVLCWWGVAEAPVGLRLCCNRQLSKDYEHRTKAGKARILLAAIHIRLKQLYPAG